MAKTKTKKFRGKGNYGRGKKAGRGAGLRGGKGNAGMHKHKRTTALFIERETGFPYWGRHGFYRHHQGAGTETSVTNVGRLAEMFPGQKDIDLTAAGIDKLLGSGSIDVRVTVKVAAASPSAVEKVKAAGGSVVLPK